jgi:hypothetical protein
MGQEMTFGAYAVTSASTIQFRPLFFRASATPADEWIVGHEPSDTAIGLPESGVIAIQHLQTGSSVAQAGEAVRLHCGEAIDVVDLIEGLAELGLVEAIDGQRCVEPETIGQRWLGRIPPGAVAWLYCRPALVFFGLISLAGPLTLIWDAAVRPQVGDVFWHASYTVDTLTLWLLSMLLLFKHELAHLLAARSRGLAAELTIGHRLFYLVAVSRVAGIWKLPRRDRLLIYSAGMGSDCVVAGASALVLLAANVGLLVISPALTAILDLVIISEYLGIAWECQVFLKTDVYQIMADLTDQHDLPEQARRLLLSVWQRMTSIIHASGEARASGYVAGATPGSISWLVLAYTAIAVLGIAGSCIWLVCYLLPAFGLAIAQESRLLLGGLHAGNLASLLDGGIALILQSISCLLLVRSWLKNARLARRHGRR